MNNFGLSFIPILRQRKLGQDLFISLLFLAIISIFRWRLDLSLLFFWFGGLVGTEFLPLTESIFQHDLKLSRPVFHTFVFQVILVVLGFYVLSSSGSFFGAGLVMVMYLQMIKDQIMELKINNFLSDGWFLYLRKEAFPIPVLRNYLIILIILFIVLTLFLIHK